MRKNLIFSIIGAMLIGGTVYWLETPEQGSGPRIGTAAPDFQWTELSGQTATLSQYRGRVVLLDFWATWCPSCQEEMPELGNLYAKYHPQGLELLAPSLDESGRSALIPYLAQHPVRWKVLLSDSSDARQFHVFDLPTAYLIDRRGVIAQKYVGPVAPDVLERDIRQAIAQEAS